MATKSQSKSSSGKSNKSSASTGGKGDIKGKKKVTVEEVCIFISCSDEYSNEIQICEI
jgi:hypothetical protein